MKPPKGQGTIQYLRSLIECHIGCNFNKGANLPVEHVYCKSLEKQGQPVQF